MILTNRQRYAIAVATATWGEYKRAGMTPVASFLKVRVLNFLAKYRTPEWEKTVDKRLEAAR